MRNALCHKLPLLTLGVFAACGASGSIRTSFSIPNGSAFVEAHGRGPALVALYENGELRGAEAFERLITTPSGRWLRNRSAIDHPSLAEWRLQLLRGQELATRRRSTAQELMEVIRPLPFAQAREDVCTHWVNRSADRAADLLDLVGRLSVTSRFTTELCSQALRTERDDERRAKWMKGFADHGQNDAAVLLVTSRYCGEDTARMALRRLGSFSSKYRFKIFSAAAPRLASSAREASLIVAAADELSTRDETPALRRLLTSRSSDDELALCSLRAIDDRPNTERLSLFALAIQHCAGDAAAAPVIVRAIEELPTTHRLEAVQAVLSRPDVDVRLIELLIEKAGLLTSSHREAFLTSLIGGPHFRKDFTAPCAQAAKRLSRRSKERVLKSLGRAASR